MRKQDDGGPAFPHDADYVRGEEPGEYQFKVEFHAGISLREYACIQLRVPETGKDWLDDLIRKSQADWFAGQAGQEAFHLLVEHSGQDWMGASLGDAIKKLAETKLAIADRMLTERSK